MRIDEFHVEESLQCSEWCIDDIPWEMICCHSGTFSHRLRSTSLTLVQ